MNQTADPQPSRPRTRQVIWDAILDLHAKEQVITREVLREVTGFRLVVIDDHVKRFIEEDESLRRVRSGVFQPVMTPPPARSVSATEIPGGMVNIEVGDQVLQLWPREARALGALLMGHGSQFSLIQAQHEAGEVNMHMAARMRRLEAQMNRILEEGGDANGEGPVAASPA